VDNPPVAKADSKPISNLHKVNGAITSKVAIKAARMGRKVLTNAQGSMCAMEPRCLNPQMMIPLTHLS
jgi:hypothetical protein